MALHKPTALRAAILDVDGVLLASPHERAWREALGGIADAAQFTTSFYQANVAGKPRLAGGIAALEALGVPDAMARAPDYCARKQKRLEELIRAGHVEAFPDALRFVRAMMSIGCPMAAASSSRNANAMMKAIPVDGGKTLFDLFTANLCGIELKRGKPDPEIFLRAAAALRIDPANCFVAEDSPAGIEAACAGGMTGLGIARLGDAPGLRAAGAALVVTSLDGVSIEALKDGLLRGTAA